MFTVLNSYPLNSGSCLKRLIKEIEYILQKFTYRFKNAALKFKDSGDTGDNKKQGK